ncbi:hypothetical protein [Metabacillus litoralis]|uniref:hypothetical protein n=1 Tax=Metabacillus litoralis TaxID=152268 RepID=UPI000EF58F27|nr:hypothetical protein [Metabacillus litoralis]
MSNILEELLDKNLKINVIQEDDLRLIIQDHEQENDCWESNLKVLKTVLNDLSSGYIEKITDDPAITEKIALLLLEFVGQYIKDINYMHDFSKQSNFDVINLFMDVYKNNSIHPEYKTFLSKYK